MQISGFSSTAQTILSNSGQNIDGSTQTTGAVAGSDQPEDSTQVSGNVDSSEAVQPAAESTQETAAPQQTAAVQTQVVTSADETLGTSLGLNIDTTA